MGAHDHAASSTLKVGLAWPLRPQVNGRALSMLPPASRAIVPVKAVISPTDQFGQELSRAMTELRRYALWLAKSPALADDLMQDALVNAWRAQDRFEPGTNLKAWCRTILRNVHISYLRRSWRIMPLADDAMEAIPSTGNDSTVALDLLAVRNGIRLLPAEQREALLLVGAGSMSYQEAADAFGCAVGTMKSRVSRARARLLTLMESNKASYNSDTELRASDALNDLMHQVEGIRGRTGKSARRHA